MDTLRVLRHPNFLRLWIAQISSIIAQNLLNFALIILVFNTTQGSSYSSLLVLSFGLPAIFLASVAGEYADVWDRRKVMIYSNLLRALLVLGYVMIGGNITLILLLSFVISCVMQFFIPAEAASIPRMVPEEELVAANSLFVSSFYSCFLLGNILAAPTIKYLGEQGPFFITAVLFSAAALIVATIPKQVTARPSETHEKAPTWRDALVSWNFIRHNPDLRFPLVQLTITQALVSVVLALAPALSLALLKEPLQAASEYFILPVGLGLVAGVLLVSRLARAGSRVRVLEVCLVLAGIALTALGASGLLYRTYEGEVLLPIEYIAWVVATLVFLLGMLNAIIAVLAQTELQEHSTDEIRGRVFGSLNLLTNLAATFPILVAGIMADLLSVTKVILILGGGMAAFAAWQLMRSYRKSLPKTVDGAGSIIRK